jgi:hypothetical protein
MGIFKAIAAGLGTTLRKPRLVVILYVVNAVFALIVAVPFLVIVQRELGHSLAGASVRPVDIMWLGETALRYGVALPALAAGFAVAGLVYLALHIFLNGGVVGRLIDREGPASLAAFMGDGGRYLGRFVRLFLASTVFYVLTFGVVLKLVAALFQPMAKGAFTEWLPLILSNIRFLVALLLLSIVHMVVDYARIAVVADQERRVLKALRHALTFLKTRFFKAWALYLLIVTITAAGTAVFYAVLKPFGGPASALVAAGALWMQLYIVFRIWVRNLFVAAQAEFYRSHPY